MSLNAALLLSKGCLFCVIPYKKESHNTTKSNLPMTSPVKGVFNLTF